MRNLKKLGTSLNKIPRYLKIGFFVSNISRLKILGERLYQRQKFEISIYHALEFEIRYF
jgi:hypothetical protein